MSASSQGFKNHVSTIYGNTVRIEELYNTHQVGKELYEIGDHSIFLVDSGTEVVIVDIEYRGNGVYQEHAVVRFEVGDAYETSVKIGQAVAKYFGALTTERKETEQQYRKQYGE